MVWCWGSTSEHFSRVWKPALEECQTHLFFALKGTLHTHTPKVFLLHPHPLQKQSLDMTSCPNCKHVLYRSLFIVTAPPNTPLTAALMSLFWTIFRRVNYSHHQVNHIVWTGFHAVCQWLQHKPEVAPSHRCCASCVSRDVKHWVF